LLDHQCMQNIQFMNGYVRMPDWRQMLHHGTETDLSWRFSPFDMEISEELAAPLWPLIGWWALWRLGSGYFLDKSGQHFHIWHESPWLIWAWGFCWHHSHAADQKALRIIRASGMSASSEDMIGMRGHVQSRSGHRNCWARIQSLPALSHLKSRTILGMGWCRKASDARLI